MANTGSFNTNSYSNRCVTFGWEAIEQSIEHNYTKIYWELRGAGSQTQWLMSGPFNVIIDGEPVYYSDTRIQLSNGTLIASGYKTIYHNTDGSRSFSVSASAAIYTYAVNCWGSGTWDLDSIPRQAYIDATRSLDFTDLDSPTVYFNNPAGSAVKVQLCISWTGGDDIAYRELDDYSHNYYTFNFTSEELNALYNATLSGSTSRYVTFYVTTIIGNSRYESTAKGLFTVTDCAPDLNPTVIDNGDASYLLTNDRNKLIRYFNYPKAIFNATAKKGASITERFVTCGSQPLSAEGDYAQFNNVDSNVFVFTVIDNRGNKVEKTVTMDMIDYVTLTCNNEIEPELNPDNTAAIHFTASGSYFKGSFGVVENTLVVEYRYKTTDTDYPVDEEGNAIWTPVIPTILESEGKYSAIGTISDLDYRSTYTVQVRARDAVYHWGVSAKDAVIKIVPVFDWGEHDFNFNVPVTMPELSTEKATIGDIVIEGSNTTFPNVNATNLNAKKVITDDLQAKNAILDNLHVKMSVTQDITVCSGSSYDMNAMTKTGLFYMGTGSLNKPVDQNGSYPNGWLEVQASIDGNYCYQQYTTYTGVKYERWRTEGTWGNWIKLVRTLIVSGSEVVRYSNSNRIMFHNFYEIKAMFEAKYGIGVGPSSPNDLGVCVSNGDFNACNVSPVSTLWQNFNLFVDLAAAINGEYRLNYAFMASI